MRLRYETEIGVDGRLTGGNKVKAIDKKSEWNNGFDKMRDQVTSVPSLPGHYTNVQLVNIDDMKQSC